MQKIICFFMLCLLIVLKVRAATENVQSRLMLVQELTAPENFTTDEWEKVVRDATDFHIDSKPTGRRRVPKTAGKSGGAPISSHIIGGSDARRGQFPWQAFLLLDSSYFCGGSLIHVNWVLTAAHCASSINQFSITLGAQNRKVTENGRVTVTSKTKFVHPQYNSNTISNDVAVIKLTAAVKLSEFIGLIRLPKIVDANLSFTNISASVSGFGLTNDSIRQVSTTLKFLTVPVISNEECLKVFGSKYVIASTICTSGVKSTGTCNGDSGGPLVYKEADGLWTQIGSVSYGSVQCESTAPSAYARLTSFLGWISNTTKIDIRRK